MDKMIVSIGQELALEQVTEICEDMEEIVDTISEPILIEDRMILNVSISTTSYIRSSGGLNFRSRENIAIIIPKKFPFEMPIASFTHNRYSGFPHVLWGNFICLYLSPDVDWNPMDGMYGFFEKLHYWFKAAASNKLDPDDAPLHPPVIYEVNHRYEFIVQASTPIINKKLNHWIGYALLNPRSQNSFEIVDWKNQSEKNTKDSLTTPSILFNFPFHLSIQQQFLIF